MTDYQENPVIQLAETMPYNLGAALEYMANASDLIVVNEFDQHDIRSISNLLKRARYHIDREIQRVCPTIPTPLTDSEAEQLLADAHDEEYHRRNREAEARLNLAVTDLYPHKEYITVYVFRTETHVTFFVEATRTLSNSDVISIKERLRTGSTVGRESGSDGEVSWRARAVVSTEEE